jgi:SAM-dependent methyltransferase
LAASSAGSDTFRSAMSDRTGVAGLSKKLAKRLGMKRPYRSLRATTVARREPQRVWSEGLASEVEFWKEALPRRVATDDSYKLRVDPKAPIRDPLLKTLIAKIPAETVSILDVGAGPLTALGKTYPGKLLSITATDPLATEYVRIMRDAGIEPPVPPTPCRGEDLLDLFGPSTFDIAFARNALDHSIDPVRVITNMVHVVKDDRFVVLRHLRREADRNLYRGLHQWNFDIEEGEFVIWRIRGEKIRVNRILGDAAAVACFEENGWVVCLMTKTTAAKRSSAPPSTSHGL